MKRGKEQRVGRDNAKRIWRDGERREREEIKETQEKKEKEKIKEGDRKERLGEKKKKV